MDCTENVERIIAEGREQYLRLLDEATNLLRSLDTTSPTLLAEAVQRRQKRIELLQNFDKHQDRLATEGSEALAVFRIFQEKITREILEIDGLLVAIAREKQTAIMGKLASLSKSAAAFQAYGKRGAIQRRWLSETM